jgi:hypothetical protein
VRDAIILSERGTPAVALITERFWQQAALVAASHGHPELPRVPLPYPVAGTGEVNVRAVAAKAAPRVLELLDAACSS